MCEIEMMKIYENIVGKGLNEKIKAVPLWIYLGIVFLQEKNDIINGPFTIWVILKYVLMFSKSMERRWNRGEFQSLYQIQMVLLGSTKYSWTATIDINDWSHCKGYVSKCLLGSPSGTVPL